MQNHLPPYPHELIADTIGQLMEYWGFKHIMGRLWTNLFLSSKPLSAPELSERLAVSAGAISMAIHDLVEWGAIRRVCLRDSRKDHYVAEDNIWKMLSRVLKERESRRIELALDNLEQALARLKESKEFQSFQPDEYQFQIRRLEELKKLAKLGSNLLHLFVMSAKLDVTPLRKLFDPSQSAKTSDAERVLS